jgi:hypothetical protein
MTLRNTSNISRVDHLLGDSRILKVDPLLLKKGLSPTGRRSLTGMQTVQSLQEQSKIKRSSRR